jgi:hypothetical protein
MSAGALNLPHTPRLAEQQNHCLAQILAPRLDAPSRGMLAYRANAHASAERALLAAYPVVAQLLGEASFNQLARALWHQQPPQHGDLAQWGDALPAFVVQDRQLADTPYVADVAHVEWALHRCASALDAAPDHASLSLLTTHDPAALHLRLAPGAQCLTSAYPVGTLVLAHTGGARLADAATLLRQRRAEQVLVWRQGYAPRLRVLAKTEQALTAALCQGQSLGQALHTLPANFDFSAWLVTAVHSGFLLGAELRAPLQPAV